MEVNAQGATIGGITSDIAIAESDVNNWKTIMQVLHVIYIALRNIPDEK